MSRPPRLIIPRLDRKTDLERRRFERNFRSKITLDAAGHHMWGGANNGRYAQVRLGGGAMFYAHRVAFVLAHGRDPHPHMVIDHACGEPLCVNPAHLEEVTAAYNILRGSGPTAINAQKIECTRGHLLAGDDVAVNSRGWRSCKRCARANYQRRRAAELVAKHDTEDRATPLVIRLSTRTPVELPPIPAELQPFGIFTKESA